MPLQVGIEERAVPQEARQATAATQPYLYGDGIVPQLIDIPPEGSSVLPNGAALVNDGKIVTPFWTDPIAMNPGTVGGTIGRRARTISRHIFYMSARARRSSGTATSVSSYTPEVLAK